MVAPSWGPSGVIETLGPELMDCLMDAGFAITLRPHPQTAKIAQDTLQGIVRKYVGSSLFTLEEDVVGRESLHVSDLMISDWSGSALEYSLGLGKPVIFIDVPKKINNPSYQELNIEPLEVHIREKIGVIVSPDSISNIPLIAEQLVYGSFDMQSFHMLRDQYVYNLGTQDQIGSQALQKILNSK